MWGRKYNGSKKSDFEMVSVGYLSIQVTRNRLVMNEKPDTLMTNEKR